MHGRRTAPTIQTMCTNSTNGLLESSKENKRKIGVPMLETESMTHKTIEQENERHEVDWPRRKYKWCLEVGVILQIHVMQKVMFFGHYRKSELNTDISESL